MPRVPKGKGGLSAGERVRLYEQEREERMKRISSLDVDTVNGAEGEQNAVDEPVADIMAAKEQVIVQKEKKVLPKPQSATVKVDLSVDIGTVGEMHGFCNGPVSYGADITPLFKEIGVPAVRFDSTDGANSAYAVDISRIFKDVSADPNDPRSYNFAVTDKYVSAAYKLGARIIFRLGESRDKLCREKKVNIPENIDLWINVCANVIKHYNDYFAGGYAFGIEYFEIWSHDYDLDRSEWAAEFEFYRRVASTVKMLDPYLKVGGMLFRGFDDAAREFIRFCRKGKVALDFITLSFFESDPIELSRKVSEANAYVKNQGFNSTEIIIGEWGYADAKVLAGLDFYSDLASDNVGDLKRSVFESQASIKGAAFAAATLLELNSQNVVRGAFFCDAQPMISPFTAICDRFGKPQKPFYAFKAFGELYRAGKATLCEVERTNVYAHSGIYACAARSMNGECYIMIASHGGCGTVDLRIDGIPDNLYTADMYLLDGVKDLALGSSTPISGAKKRMILSLCEYGAVLIKLY